MKRTLLSLAALAAVFATSPASAQNYPSYARYCVDTQMDQSGVAMVCMYETLAQCQASRARQHERCFLNPAFAGSRDRR